MKYKQILFWFTVFVALFAWLQIKFQYHFYYIEQSQLFLFAPDYWGEKIMTLGGFSALLSEFLVQFFIYPYVGPVVVAALLTLVGICTAGICKQLAPQVKFFLFYLLPVIALLFMHFDFNYRVQGTVSYLLMLIALLGYLRIRQDRWRLLVGCISVPILLIAAGSVAGLFALTACFIEFLKRTPKAYLSLLMVAEVGLLGVCCVCFAWIGEFRLAFLPDLYYHQMLHPKTAIYYAWIALPFILFLAYGLRNKQGFKGKSRWVSGTICLLQIAFVSFLLCWGIPKYGDEKTLKLKELDYYTRMEQWDKIIEACEGKLTNYLYMCHLNMALVQKGELLDRMFAFDQRGPNGVLVQWNKSEYMSCLLSDIYFTMGATASAQEMAFEGNICAVGEGNPRMLKRLVQTNLVYGTYSIAEKYILLLEKTFAYRGWAHAQRRFLNNDAAVEADPVLGSRRKLLPEASSLAMMNGLAGDLEQFAQHAPANSPAMQYLGAMFLLSKDLKGFKALIEKYYGTEILPSLPVHFQEAVIVLSEQEPDYWKRFHVSETIAARFADYKKQVLANRNNRAAVAGLLNRSYGNTYWFYFMFK